MWYGDVVVVTVAFCSRCSCCRCWWQTVDWSRVLNFVVVLSANFVQYTVCIVYRVWLKNVPRTKNAISPKRLDFLSKRFFVLLFTKFACINAGISQTNVSQMYGSFRYRVVQVKLWDPLRMRAIPEHLRGAFTTRRYTNRRSPYLAFYRTLSRFREIAYFVEVYFQSHPTFHSLILWEWFDWL